MTKPMTTDELIVILKQYPGMRVLVDGYDTGFSDPGITTEMVVRLASPFEWEGDYIATTTGGRTKGSHFNAVIIKRDHFRT